VEEAPRPLRVPTERIQAVVRTTGQVIVGRLHAEPGKRLKDEMNHTSTRFIAVTEARVYDPSGTLLYQTDFLLLANEHIVSITPRQSMKAGEPPWFEPASS
jgi:uncharacterized protein DUF6812